MKGYLIHILLGGLIFLCGCKEENQFVVFSDPWCSDYAEAVLEEFQDVHPEIDITLTIRSSEVIAQRLSFGERIDFVFGLDSSLFQGEMFSKGLVECQPLAPARVVKVRRKNGLNKAIPGAGGTMLEASDRPTRRAAEQWFLSQPSAQPKDSITIANFFDQARDYLIEGWVREGFTLDLLVRQYPNQLEIVSKGPLIPGGFLAYASWRGSDSAGYELSKFLTTQKCKALLADYKIIE